MKNCGTQTPNICLIYLIGTELHQLEVPGNFRGIEGRHAHICSLKKGFIFTEISITP